MRRHDSARKDSRPKPKKTIWEKRWVFIHISRLSNSFGLALFFGLRRSCLAAMDSSGTSLKWLEELVSERNKQLNGANLWLSIDISGRMYLFGLTLFLWYENKLFCFSGLQQGHQETHMKKYWGRSRSRHIMNV